MSDGDQPDEREIYRGRILTLKVKTVELGDGRRAQREIVEHADGAAVVAVDRDQGVVLVRQMRPAVGARVLELPAGLVEAGEEPLACAARELTEETGLRASHISPLVRFYGSPGFATELIHIFVATDLRAVDGVAGDEEEQLEVVRLPLAEAIRQVLETEISDAKTVTGLLAYARQVGATVGRRQDS